MKVKHGGSHGRGKDREEIPGYDDRPDEVTTYTYRLAPYKGNGTD